MEYIIAFGFLLVVVSFVKPLDQMQNSDNPSYFNVYFNDYGQMYEDKIIDEKTYKVYSPIEMKSRDCKKCHGLEEKIDKESRDNFTAAYKNNKAYGYKSGEIRGSVVISISK